MTDFWQGFIVATMTIAALTVAIPFYVDMWCGLTYRPSKFGWFDRW